MRDKTKYELERLEAKRALEAAEAREEDSMTVERLVLRVLSRVACDFCLNMAAQNRVMERVKQAVDLSLTEAILQAIEAEVPELFDN